MQICNKEFILILQLATYISKNKEKLEVQTCLGHKIQTRLDNKFDTRDKFDTHFIS